MGYKAIKINEFYCTECGQKGIPIPRCKGNLRNSGHLKKIFCIHCGKETNHVEICGSYCEDDFRKEFEKGRFIDGLRVPLSECQICNVDCPYRVLDRCWNANHSFKCEYRKEDNNG